MQQNIEERIQDFSALCRKHGLKITHQRIEIFRAVLEADGHPTAEDVFYRIRGRLPTVSMDTVYRTLSLFEDHDLIARVQCLSDKGRYDPNLQSHHHFICTQCKGIYDFFWDDFDELPLPAEAKSQGDIRLKKVELRGICQVCRQKK
ncbi:transcriptional repressor [bacterium]|nr:transcriptional repressor [bacterium]